MKSVPEEREYVGYHLFMAVVNLTLDGTHSLEYLT